MQDAYEELLLMVGSRGSGLNRALSLKAQYEAALRDLTDLVDTAQDKIAADQKMTVASVTEVQMLLDKHKVRCHSFFKTFNQSTFDFLKWTNELGL